MLLMAQAATRFRIAVVVAFWGAAVAIGLGAMARYEFTSGTVADAPQSWPGDSSICRHDDRPTLVMFAHPRCPCTRASLSELAELLSGTGTPVDVKVLFCVPARGDEAWTGGGNWNDASAIDRARILRDEGGVEAHRFGARTSGQVMMFNSAGILIFNGGITGGRGHVGENLGRNSVAALLRGQAVSVHQTPVYGCELVGAEKCPLCVSKETP